MRLTQSIVADHLDISQPAVSGLLSRLAIDLEAASLDQIRRAYIRHLRAAAAGHGGDAMQAERLRLTAARRGKAELELRLRSGELVEAKAVGRGITTASATMRGALERIGDRLGPRLSNESDPELCAALISNEIEEVLRQLAVDLRALSAPAPEVGEGGADFPLNEE